MLISRTCQLLVWSMPWSVTMFSLTALTCRTNSYVAVRLIDILLCLMNYTIIIIILYIHTPILYFTPLHPHTCIHMQQLRPSLFSIPHNPYTHTTLAPLDSLVNLTVSHIMMFVCIYSISSSIYQHVSFLNMQLNEDNYEITLSQVSIFANISATETLLQTEDFFSDVSTVLENVADFIKSSSITLNSTVSKCVFVVWV